MTSTESETSASTGVHRYLQPLLNALVSTTTAPTTALGGPDGQIRPAGVQGVFHADLRALSLALLRVDGDEPEPIMHAPHGPGRAVFVGLARRLGDPGPDPTVRVLRHRRARGDGLAERVEVVSTAADPIRATVTLDVACDLTPVSEVKAGRADGRAPVPPTRDQSGALCWHSDGVDVTLDPGEARVALAGGAEGIARLTWIVELPARGSATLAWGLRIADKHAVVLPPVRPVEWSRPAVVADDARLVRLIERSLDDLESLRLTPADRPGDTFLGAGVPWFLTLFGRDSLWAARMMLPLGTGIAAGTLRVLAARQGRRRDPATGEAPGKIMHELRRGDFEVFAPRGGGGEIRLPATYYGTVDATLLWISLLHDAWRWGMPPAEVRELLPHLEAALGWLAGYADPDGDGFVEYIDESGHGLANQGWKDSGDAVRFADGRRAAPPIALCEVQGYAHEAALHGAALLDAFDRPGGDRWRAYAAELNDRFRARFWVDGGYPALALDRDKHPVDALTSNIGHLLGTGLLTAEEEARVAARLAEPDMAGGFGLRTMSGRAGGYSPMSYHCGSVWTHDTAIVLGRLAAAGHAEVAARLAGGLLAAAEAFDYRLPELHAGDARLDLPRPVPYPAACRPQAWSAASAIVLLNVALGVTPDVPAGTVRLAPLPGAPLGAVAARGLRVAGVPIDVAVDRAGVAELTGLPDPVRVPAQRTGAPTGVPREAV
ncbi:glycogen debranching N-terminal domain-containing protein [Rhizomonospora bruguierae]|uniref:glycogen debranching N-terminal domain-containing protein n=1 Tax=Rhizomonospora bruguierae TaxID=1581705 RepID=UPI001BCAF1A7|nr:glycogen debranching N-terminal domain-containing protein [Micromonospora sp. NBRC 107566]